MSRASFPMVVHVLLCRRAPEPQVFLLRRANTGFLDGYFGLPGGHVQSGELPIAAVVRECEEETGATPLNVQPLCAMPYRSGGEVGVNLVFSANQFAQDPTVAEPALADLGVWAHEQALPQPRAGWISRVLSMRDQGPWYCEIDSG